MTAPHATALRVVELAADRGGCDMGATLGILASEGDYVASWAERAALVRMALSALDDEEVPLYFGGREALVKAVYRGRLESDPRRRQTQYRYVRRLVRGLRGAKLIEPLDKADPRARAVRAQYPRVRAVYALNRAALEHGQGYLSRAPLAADEETSQEVPPGGPPPRSPGGTRRTHEGGAL